MKESRGASLIPRPHQLKLPDQKGRLAKRWRITTQVSNQLNPVASRADEKLSIHVLNHKN